jgi:hypothetical protein
MTTPGTLRVPVFFFELNCCATSLPFGFQMIAETGPEAPRLRVRVFVDFWNFSLALRGIDADFRVDWQKIGPVLAQSSGQLIDAGAPVAYEGMTVYGSYDPGKPQDAKLRSWFSNTLDKMAGVSVVLQARQRKKGYPKCPACQAEVAVCAVCSADMRGTEEKGVDTRIATDMVSLAWANAFNCAVLLSSDKDFVPVAEFLQTRGIKVIHGAFPPLGSALTQKCWGHLHLGAMRDLFRRI